MRNDHRKTHVCVRERRGRYLKKKNLFAYSLAVADAVYTLQRAVRREASAVTAKIQHGPVFSLAFIS